MSFIPVTSNALTSCTTTLPVNSTLSTPIPITSNLSTSFLQAPSLQVQQPNLTYLQPPAVQIQQPNVTYLQAPNVITETPNNVYLQASPLTQLPVTIVEPPPTSFIQTPIPCGSKVKKIKTNCKCVSECQELFIDCNGHCRYGYRIKCKSGCKCNCHGSYCNSCKGQCTGQCRYKVTIKRKKCKGVCTCGHC